MVKNVAVNPYAIHVTICKKARLCTTKDNRFKHVSGLLISECIGKPGCPIHSVTLPW